MLNRLKPHQFIHYDPDALRKNRQYLRHLHQYITVPQPDELLMVKLKDLRTDPPDFTLEASES